MYAMDIAFPGGNGLDLGSGPGPDGIWEQRFTADPRSGPERLWFHVRFAPAAAAGPLRVVLEFAEGLLGAGGPDAAVHPVWRSSAGPWRRLDVPAVRHEPDGRWSWAWTLPAQPAPVEIAACLPYGEAELAGLAAALPAPWTCRPMGVSAAGRGLPRIASDPGKPGGDRPGIYLVARQHAGETPGSWILDGALRRLAAAGAAAPLVWAVPFADLDGVVEGRYGKHHWPYDLNRCWMPGSYRIEVATIMADLGRWAQRCRPRLVLDLHAPGYAETGCYAYLPPTTDGLPAQETAVAAALAAALGPCVAPPFARTAGYMGEFAAALGIREPPTLHHFARRRGWPALSLEFSYQRLGGGPAGIPDYLEAGARLADGILTAVEAMP